MATLKRLHEILFLTFLMMFWDLLLQSMAEAVWMGRSLAALRPALGGFSGQEMPSGVSVCPSIEEQTMNCHKSSPRVLEMYLRSSRNADCPGIWILFLLDLIMRVKKFLTPINSGISRRS